MDTVNEAQFRRKIGIVGILQSEIHKHKGGVAVCEHDREHHVDRHHQVIRGAPRHNQVIAAIKRILLNHASSHKRREIRNGERKVLVVRAFIAVQSTEWNRVGNVWIVIVYVIPSPRFIPLYANSAKWGRAYWLLALDMLLFG